MLCRQFNARTRFIASILVGISALSGCNEPETMPTEENAPSDNAPAAETDNEAQTSSAAPEASAEDQGLSAVVQLEPIGDSGVSGTVRFVAHGNEVAIDGEVSGLEPGKHGFHVHEHGDLSDKETGKSAGGHYNPTDEPHGRPSDEQRHVGDLGNIEAGDDGTAQVDKEDAVITLVGPNSIVGRALVIHANADEFTQPSGDAGDRVAFGVIEMTDQQNP